ncbi:MULTISPECIES: PaaI family thioesterase [unclassified Mesorhizobium]|uniref:PaaI family thioesterase n=1 Tax=unclassified Mesorhizobium TaxID=325217 RepID=UPI00333649D3
MNPAALERLLAIRDGLEPLPKLYASLGLQVVSAEVGSVRIHLLPMDGHTNPHGFMGGGVIATVLDTSTAWVCDTMCAPGEACVTIDLNVNFLRPVRIDDSVLLAHATMVHSGSRIMVAEGKLWQADGKLVATAKSTCMVVASDPVTRPRGSSVDRLSK